jgi:hypothetical protein
MDGIIVAGQTHRRIGLPGSSFELNRGGALPTNTAQHVRNGLPARSGPESTPRWPEPRVYEALTDLSAYALRFDFEVQRLNDRLAELAAAETSAAERRALMRERDEMVEELQAFRGAISAFQRDVLHRAS